jgi:hypothetical protein
MIGPVGTLLSGVARQGPRARRIRPAASRCCSCGRGGPGFPGPVHRSASPGGDPEAAGPHPLRFERPAGVAVRIPSFPSQSGTEDAAAARVQERRRSRSGRAGCPPFGAFCPRVAAYPLPFRRRQERRMRPSPRRVPAGNGGGSWGGRAGCPPFRAFCPRVAAHPLPFRCRQERRMRPSPRRLPAGNGGGSWGGRPGRPPFRASCRRGGTYPLRFCRSQERRMRPPTRRIPRRTEVDRGAVRAECPPFLAGARCGGVGVLRFWCCRKGRMPWAARRAPRETEEVSCVQ